MVLVKICGVRSAKDAEMALKLGADVIGIILVPHRGRTVDLQTAKAISAVVHADYHKPKEIASTSKDGGINTSVFARNACNIRKLATKPLLVGVFMNQELEEIRRLQQEIGLDIVQLHGKEPLNICTKIEGPVIKRFTPQSEQYGQWSEQGYHSAILIDGETGGNGELVNWELLEGISSTGAEFILGGGITPANVQSAVSVEGVFMVDVSSGVEDTEGENKGFKNEEKVKEFIKRAKSFSK